MTATVLTKKTDMRIQTLNFSKPSASVLDAAAKCLREGGIVVAPTETQYGLLARADSNTSVDRIIRTKNRNLQLPLSVFVPSVDMIPLWAELSSEAQTLAERFLPGPLTIILPSKEGSVLPVVRDNKLGIRVSSAPIIQGIMTGVDFPVTATSANISGSKSLPSIKAISDLFGDAVDYYIDAGHIDGLASTVVDCTCHPVKILREGAISSSEIETALRDLK